MALNIFLFHRDLRIIDNTTLIDQCINEENITPIFIFTPEQINQKKNKYFSNGSVQFMIESLHELSNSIEKKLYFFYGDNLKVIKKIHKKIGINSIGWNIDYTPYARKRDNDLKELCNKLNIKVYEKEDYVLYNILDGQGLKKDDTPYTVYTPFKNYCLSNLKVRDINKFKNFKFKKSSDIEKIKYYIDKKEIDNFYENNENIHIYGGRLNGLKILKNIKNFKDYSEMRDYLTYKTTFLSSHNHFSTVSIREVYHSIVDVFGKNCNLIMEILWREFYLHLYYHFPYMLQGQIYEKNNLLFKNKFNEIKWNYDETLFEKWCNGQLGIPIVDAAIKQLNTINYMHNRMRMVTASVATKILLLPWYLCEKYFASKLQDYDPIMNNAGWQWTIGGVDPQNALRIFSPKNQSLKFDPDCIYIKTWLPELENIPNVDIHNWETSYKKYDNIYIKPIIDYSSQRKKSMNEILRVNKLKME